MKKNIFTFLLMLAPCLLFAQQDAMVSMYMFNGLVLNPAYAGTHKYANATALYRKQWVGFEGAPTTQIFSADGPIKNKKIGLGLLLSNDKIGVAKQTEIYGNYSYHLDLSSKLRLSMGLRAGGAIYSAKLTQLTVWDENDEVFANDITTKFLPNFGGGLYLYSDKFFAGLSAPHIINYKPKTTFYINKTDAPQLIRHYYATAGYVFDGNENLIFKPSILLKYVSAAPFQADFNLNILIHKIIWIGGSYRTGDSFVSLVELQAGKHLRIGYAYDIPMNKLRKYNNGSHEVMVAFDFGQSVMKMRNPRYF